jgi:integrase
MQKWKREIESGAIEPEQAGPTFASALVSYLNAGGENRFMDPLLEHFKSMPLAKITQAKLDAAAVEIYPNGALATRNRQVYSPVAAILHHAGAKVEFKRPKGAAGTPRSRYLSEVEAFRVLDAADASSARFGAFCTFLLYTGCRLSEGLRLEWQDVSLPDATAFIRLTKNGAPRRVFLPEAVVAALANLDGERAGRLFPWTKGGPLNDRFRGVAAAAAVDLPGVAFHIFRHTYGAWMRRYAKLDTAGLVGTGAWKSHDAARVYEHIDASAEARKAEMLPTRGKSVG